MKCVSHHFIRLQSDNWRIWLLMHFYFWAVPARTLLVRIFIYVLYKYKLIKYRQVKVFHAFSESSKEYSLIYEYTAWRGRDNTVENKLWSDVFSHFMKVCFLNIIPELNSCSSELPYGSERLFARPFESPFHQRRLSHTWLPFQFLSVDLQIYILNAQIDTRAHTNKESGGRAPLSLASRCVAARL